MCTHSTIHRNEWGGVEVYQQTLSTMFEREIDVFFWLRRDGQCHLMDDRGMVLERFDMHEIGWLDSLTDAPEEVAFSNVIGQYSFDLVHFQHLGHHTASLPIIAKAAGAGTVFSAHDFFLVCSRYNLLNHEQVFCDIGHKSISACDICLRISENVPAGAQQTRRAFMTEVIRSIDVFLFGTEYSEWLTLTIYPELARRRRAVLGIPMPSSTGIDTPSSHPEVEDAPLVIAVVGNFLRSKGADAIMSLIEEANPELFSFRLLGDAEPQYAEVFDRWDKPNVVYHGRYSPGDLGTIAHADVALHLSIWPETYCISLSEIWQAGLIPIVSDIGALSDRVIHGVNGFKVGIGNTSAVLDHLALLRASPATRRAMRANIGPHLWTNYRHYAASLLEIYRSVAPARALGDVGLGLDVGQLHLLPHSSWKKLAPPRHIFDPSRRSAIRLELPSNIQDWSHIQGSEVYIDSVCGMTPEMLDRAGSPGGRFKPAPDLQVTGWSFVPNIRVGGQIFLALVGDETGPVIFFPATRDIRDDIMSKFAGAPRRSGFSGQIALRGKWCEGRYQLALVNSFGDRAAFCLTALRIEVEDGKVIKAVLAPPSNASILRAFHRVAKQTGEDLDIALPRLPVKDHAWGRGQSLQHHIDQVCEIEGAEAGHRELPSRLFRFKGWAFVPGAGLAGRLYVGLVDRMAGTRIFVPTSREVRGDLATHYSDAPLCSGFHAQVEIGSGWQDGVFECVLVNIVNGLASSHLTGFEMTIQDGCITAVVKNDVDEARTQQVEARLKNLPIEITLPVAAAVPVPPKAETQPKVETVTPTPQRAELAREGRRKATVRQSG
jgi:glycosyltransferase involved in cell wall biosynthesis